MAAIAADAQVTATAQTSPDGTAARTIVLLDHSTGATAGTFGNDHLAGGSEDDLVFGQLGDDVIQGDGSVSLLGPSVDNYDGTTDGDDSSNPSTENTQ